MISMPKSFCTITLHLRLAIFLDCENRSGIIVPDRVKILVGIKIIKNLCGKRQLMENWFY